MYNNKKNSLSVESDFLMIRKWTVFENDKI